MRQRGRLGVSALSVVHAVTEDRQLPPDDMPDAEQSIWLQITNALPASWFNDENIHLLAQYCRVINRANQIAAVIQTKNPKGHEWLTLIQQEGKLTQQMAMLATKMRLAQQSTYDKSKVKKRAKHVRPWESAEETED